MQYEYLNVWKLYAHMHDLCMMTADRQTFLTQTVSKDKHKQPVLHLKRESQVHRRVSKSDEGKRYQEAKISAGDGHQSFQLGTCVIVRIKSAI